ncbi:MAG TPA: hypothetical protein VLJ11_06310 [Bryobacteraceae bacterium]|nr:hypothetical protein [Bryobacteraceae bacterium]
MSQKTTLLGAAQLLAVLIFLPSSSTAQALPVCSWPLETTGSGISNVAYPDTNATYWTMPFDSARWQSIVITGVYPQARFFSFVSYDAKGSVVEDHSALNDVDINPDAGSTNPFRESAVAGEPQHYTVTISRTASMENEPNSLQFANTRLGWIIYRIYVANQGLQRNAGVPLPTVSVVSLDGRSHLVPPCPSRHRSAAVAELVTALARQGFDANAAFRQLINSAAPSPGAETSCQPTPLVSWIPKNTGGYFPNPANKYIAIPGLCFQPGRILIVRGKGPVFPDTYNGGPIWKPDGIQTRYWSMCNNDQRSPYPVVACQADHSTNLDQSGYYTYVISKPERGEAPSWVPPEATWLELGSQTDTKILLVRNMLPDPNFQNSVQAAISAGCVVDNQPGVPPSRDEVVQQGQCAHDVMKDYYPKAVYCDKQVFISQGWQGCFAATESGVQE